MEKKPYADRLEERKNILRSRGGCKSYTVQELRAKYPTLMRLSRAVAIELQKKATAMNVLAGEARMLVRAHDGGTWFDYIAAPKSIV